MRCSVWIHPPGRDPFELVLAAEPEYTEGPLGPLDAMVLCRYPDRHRDRLIDARVSIHPPKGDVWLGRVADITDMDGHALLVCAGVAADLAREYPGPLHYCDTAFSEWRGREVSSRDTRIAVSQTSIGWELKWEQGHTFAANRHNGIWLSIPATNGSRLEFDWTRASQSGYQYLILAGVSPGSTEGGASDYGTAIATQSTSSGGTSGTAGIDIAKNAVETLLIYIRNTAEITPATNIVYTISNIKVYGVDGVTSVTAPNVINDLSSRIPAWMDFDTSGAWVDADATIIEPLVFDANFQIADCVNELAALRGRELSVRAKFSDGRVRPAFVSRAIDTTPAYQAHPESVEGKVSGGGILSLADRMRVFYQDSDGRSRHVDVVDESDDNYLYRIGQPRTITETLPTASTATATSFAQARLQRMRRQPAVGTPTIVAPITDLRGAQVIPAQITTNRYIRFHDTPIGTADGLITYVRHIGADRAELVLGGDSPVLEAELAMMHKRQR